MDTRTSSRLVREKAVLNTAGMPRSRERLVIETHTGRCDGNASTPDALELRIEKNSVCIWYAHQP
jgi:hypothetical protein